MNQEANESQQNHMKESIETTRGVKGLGGNAGKNGRSPHEFFRRILRMQAEAIRATSKSVGKQVDRGGQKSKKRERTTLREKGEIY